MLNCQRIQSETPRSNSWWWQLCLMTVQVLWLPTRNPAVASPLLPHWRFFVLLENELDYNLEEFFCLSQVSSTATIATAFFQALKKKAFDCISFLTTCWIAVQMITLSKIGWKHWHEPLATVDTNCSSPCRSKQPQKVWLTWTLSRQAWREYKTAPLEPTGGIKMKLNSWSLISRLRQRRRLKSKWTWQKPLQSPKSRMSLDNGRLGLSICSWHMV